MSTYKSIKFYRFETQPSLYNNGITPLSTVELLKRVFPQCKNYICEYCNVEYNIDIIEMGENYLFGACAKNNDLKYDNFYQIRDKLTHKAVPYSSVSADTQLEVYTYFYIDCRINRMAVLQHKNISRIHEILTEGIFTLSGNTLKVFCAPERIKNVKSAAKKIKSDKKLHLTFAPNSSKYSIDSLTKSLGDLQYDSYSIDLKLSANNDDSVIEKLCDVVLGDRESITNSRLSGKTESGLEETIDFIETIFTQSVPIEIDENIVKNRDNIKEKLINSLNTVNNY